MCFISTKCFEQVKRIETLLNLTLSHLQMHFDASTQTAFKNIISELEIADDDEQFCILPLCFIIPDSFTLIIAFFLPQERS